MFGITLTFIFYHMKTGMTTFFYGQNGLAILTLKKQVRRFSVPARGVVLFCHDASFRRIVSAPFLFFVRGVEAEAVVLFGVHIVAGL